MLEPFSIPRLPWGCSTGQAIPPECSLSQLSSYRWCQSSCHTRIMLPCCSFRTTAKSFKTCSRFSKPCKTDSSKGPREIYVLFMVKQALRQKDIYETPPAHASLRWSSFQTSCSCVPLLLSSLDLGTNQLCAFSAPGVQTCEQIQGVTCICRIY